MQAQRQPPFDRAAGYKQLEVVARIDRVRDRHRSPEIARHLLSCVDSLATLRRADERFTQRVQALGLSLRRYPQAKGGA